MEPIKQKVLSSLIWKFGERISAQAVTFIVSIILARLLEPSHYGAIAVVNVFIALANVFVSEGFSTSLIQKKDADRLDFSSVFYVNILLSVILYLIIYFCAPYIAYFYNMSVLCPALRVLGLRLFVGAINGVQYAYVAKNMLFKKFFWSTLFGAIFSGIVGVVLAYKGFGIWALIAQYITNTTVGTLVLWFTVRWRPIFAFSLKRLSSLFSYGWKMLVSSFLDTGYKELRTFVIGKMYSSSDLAYYTKGKSFPDLVITNINASIQNVLFPAMSSQQDDKSALKSMVRRSICLSSYVVLPLMIGLALIAEPFVKILLTDKWLFCVPYLQISCLTLAFFPIHATNLQAIKAIGRSDLFLKLEIIKKTIGLVLLFISMRYGVFAIAFSMLISTVLSSYVNAFPNKKLLGYKYLEQIKDMFLGIIPLCSMSIAVICIGLLPINNYVLITLQVLTGAAVYITVSAVTRNESFTYLVDIIKGFIKKKPN